MPKSFAIKDLVNISEDGGVSAELSMHPALRHASVAIEGRRLWLQFFLLGTEMIVTKSGRRMFPTMQLRLAGLQRDAAYSVMVDFEPLGDVRFRYSFHQSRWLAAAPADAELPARVFVHPQSPALGTHWMRHAVSFEKIKLTNNQLDANGFIIVNSMHRYQPRVHLLVDDAAARSSAYQCCRLFSLPEMAFIAVTAYQNHLVTQLKIACNPFAKGFREPTDEHPEAGVCLTQVVPRTCPFFLPERNC